MDNLKWPQAKRQGGAFSYDPLAGGYNYNTERQ
jgi:hypothetical protein